MTEQGAGLMTKLVPYYRVSTKGQGASGLGLDGQRAAVMAFAQAKGGKIVAEFKEVEAARRPRRTRERESSEPGEPARPRRGEARPHGAVRPVPVGTGGERR